MPDINRLQARQYSLSDAPHPEYYRITVKKESAFKDGGLNAKTHSGYISNILHSETDVGDTIQVSHPAGDFFLDIREREFSDAPVVLISVGIGLTPNISILNTMIAKQSNREISWIHGARDSRAQAFAEHIKEIVSTHSNVQSHVFLKNPARVDREGTDYQFKGRVNLNMLEKDHDLFIHDGRAQYYTCGPVDFLSDIEVALSDFGVDRARIKLEVFDTGEVPRSARVLRA